MLLFPVFVEGLPPLVNVSTLAASILHTVCLLHRVVLGRIDRLSHGCTPALTGSTCRALLLLVRTSVRERGAFEGVGGVAVLREERVRERRAQMLFER